MSSHYLGSVLRREAAPRDSEADGPSGCTFHSGPIELRLQRLGSHWWFYHDQSHALLIRGHAVARVSPAVPVGDWVLGHYRRQGRLPIGKLEGSFTLVLLDGQKGCVLLYRHLVGNGFTYYTEDRDGFRFGSNLAELVDASPSVPRPNRDALPAYFLYRFVPGRETLFRGIYRLMPGELVTYDARGLRRTQLRTFADLRGTDRPGPDLVDAVEHTFAHVVRDQVEADPRTANLLSGGVDSSYLQATWNRVRPASGEANVSFSVSVSHPRTRPDTAYALSMANALRTRHTLVPADAPYAEYLIDGIAATGEPPNHVFAAYFGHLARVMAGHGFTTALCGEGADSLFGVGTADELRKARVLRALVPLGGLRRWGRRQAAAAGRPRLAYYLGLAECLYDLADPEHPVNQVAAFADWPCVEACFGTTAVRAACAYRRELLQQYRVPEDPLEQLHACAYLGEAIDSASLWTTLFNQAGMDLACPFLDSRVLRLALNLPSRHRFPRSQPKGLLKQALSRHVPPELVYRKKLGFGQPVFEWLGPGGQLRALAERIGAYEFLDPKVRAAALARPSWFLYSLLCYDLWHGLFIEQRIPRERTTSAALPASAEANACAKRR